MPELPAPPVKSRVWYYEIDPRRPWPDGSLRLSGRCSTCNSFPGDENVNWVKEESFKSRDLRAHKVLVFNGEPQFKKITDEDRASEEQRAPAAPTAEACKRLQAAAKDLVGSINETSAVQVLRDLVEITCKRVNV